MAITASDLTGLPKFQGKILKGIKKDWRDARETPFLTQQYGIYGQQRHAAEDNMRRGIQGSFGGNATGLMPAMEARVNNTNDYYTLRHRANLQRIAQQRAAAAAWLQQIMARKGWDLSRFNANLSEDSLGAQLAMAGAQAGGAGGGFMSGIMGGI